MLKKNVSGQYLYFTLVSALSGNVVTGSSGAISGRKSLDGLSGMIVLSGNIVELGGGSYRANLYDFDTNGDFAGYLFTASGCVPVQYSMVTQGGISGYTFLGSGQSTLVASGTLSGQLGSVWDEPLTGNSHNGPTTAGRILRTLQDTGNYTFGAVWLDTGGTNSGTAFPTDGTFLNPVNTWPHALTVAAAATQPIRRLFCLNGTSFTLQSGLYGWHIDGDSYSLAPAGFGMAGCVVTHGFVSGTVAASTSGAPPVFDTCPIGTATLPPSVLVNCGIQTTLTLNGSGGYSVVNCFSESQGAAAATIDLVSGSPLISLKIRNWAGGLVLKNITSGDVVTVNGMGSLTVDPTCVGGTLFIRGLFQLTNSGNVTSFADSARFGSGNVWPASGAISASVFSSGVLSKAIPQNVHTWNFSGAPNVSGQRNLLNAARNLVNKWSLTANSGRYTLYDESDLNEVLTKDVTTTSGATPITTLDTN